jgi:mono/diheme cytochrome c family protein
LTQHLCALFAFILIGIGLVPSPAGAQSGPSAETLARGRYMVVTGHCNNCHTAGYQQSLGKVPDKEWLTGRDIGHRGPWGTTYPTNLRANVNKMSDAEWVAYAGTLRTRPGMPWWSLHGTTPEDLRAMYHFIRSLGPSDKPSLAALPPDQEPKTPYIVSPPERNLGAQGPDEAKSAAGAANQPPSPRDAMLARGRYMLVTGHCNNCHTAGYGAAQGRIPEKDWLKGSPIGQRGAWGTTYSTNLRINAGLMTEAQWVTYARSGQPRPPMPWWAMHETEVEDLRAMYQYIKTLGPPGDPAPTALPPEIEPTTPYTQWPALFAK